MTLHNSRPIIGCAVDLDHLELHRDWILEKQRDVELQAFFRSDVLDGDWMPLAERAKRLLDGYRGRLGIHGPFWGFKIDSHDAAIRAVVIKRLQQGLDVCAAVGATQMVIHSPYTTWDYNNLDNNRGARDGVIERVHLTLGDVVKRAADMGCELVIENIEDKDPRDRIALVQSFNSPAVRVSLDTGHAFYAFHSTGGAPVDYHIELAGEWLTHVHVQDADGYADRHWLPGEGDINWHAVFGALARQPHQPRLVLELKEPARLRKAADWLEAQGLVQ